MFFLQGRYSRSEKENSCQSLLYKKPFSGLLNLFYEARSSLAFVFAMTSRTDTKDHGQIVFFF